MSSDRRAEADALVQIGPRLDRVQQVAEILGPALDDADALAADIGGVYSVSRYNAETQDLNWRMPGAAGVNFPVRVGYPYIVCLDETAPGEWP